VVDVPSAHQPQECEHDANSRTPQEHDALIDQLNKIPTWRSLPFVQNNRVYTYDMEMVYGSPSGQTTFLEVVRNALTQP